MALAEDFVRAGTDHPLSQQNSRRLRKRQENLNDRTTFGSFDQPDHLEACVIDVRVRAVFARRPWQGYRRCRARRGEACSAGPREPMLVAMNAWRQRIWKLPNDHFDDETVGSDLHGACKRFYTLHESHTC